MQTAVGLHRLGLSYDDYLAMAKDISYEKIDRYCIFEELGVGGFAHVYRGMDDHTKYQVAIKLIDLREIKQEKSKFLQQIKFRLSKTEDKMMRRCSSTNLVKCHDVYLNEDIKIIVMEYCNGGTLDEFLTDQGKVSENQAILIIKQILNGISVLP